MLSNVTESLWLVCCFFFFLHFFIGVELLCHVILVSAIQYRESVNVYIYPVPFGLPSHSPIPLSRSSQSTKLGSLCYIAASH